MEEIKVGEYVRIKNGPIRKVIAINEGKEKTIFGKYRLDKDYNNCRSVAEKKIVKPSENIIDLIEVGDYVNGIKVTGVMSGYVYLDKIDIETKKVKTLTDYQIKDIITKEQINQVKYEV